MAELEKIEQIQKDLPQYWEGRENMLVRFYIYAQMGLNAVNNLKYLVAAIIALYVVLKLTNPMWMVAIGLVSIPCLIVLGRWQLYRVNKINEYVTQTKGTVLGYNSYNMQVRTIELLESIDKKLNAKQD